MGAAGGRWRRSFIGILSKIDDRHDRVEKSSCHPGRGMTDLHLLRGHMPHFVVTCSRIEGAHKPA
jgi:hypothetical protein